jgi:hypothetical protein
VKIGKRLPDAAVSTVASARRASALHPPSIVYKVTRPYLLE